MQLLAETIAEPDEIWLVSEHPRGINEAPITRRRYFARFEIEGQTTPMIGVFEWGKD